MRRAEHPTFQVSSELECHQKEGRVRANPIDDLALERRDLRSDEVRNVQNFFAWLHTDRPKPYLLQLADVIESFSEPDRQLDARIAVAIFPALGELPRIDEAAWQHPDGSRVRALRYTYARAAASTLIPPGHWVEQDRKLCERFWVCGPVADHRVSAINSFPGLAISAAALRAVHAVRRLPHG